MVGKTNGGSVGSSLNFKIIPYVTEEALLSATPTENTIGVVTTAKITSWIFCPSEPSKPVDGMLWIGIGSYSPGAFNALKKNTIMIYPVYARQHVGGSWVDVTAMNYLGGTWVEWTIDIIVYDSAATDIALELDNAKDSGTYLTLTLGKNDNATVKSEPVRLSGQKTLEVVYRNLSGGGSFAGGIRARVWNKGGEMVLETSRSTASSGTLTLDISSLTGEYSVGVYASNTSGSYAGSCRVKSIKVLMGAGTSEAAEKAAAYDILTGVSG